MILLTGGTGFLGRRVVKELCLRGKKLRCLVRKTSNLAPLKGFPIEISYGDIRDINSLKEAAKGCKVAIHLAAIISERKGATFEGINYQGTKNLIAASKEEGIEKIIYMSNLGAGPDKAFPFLYSKWKAEEEVKRSGLSYIIFRPSIIFGEGDGLVSLLARLIKRMPFVVIPGSGKSKFQLISVDEVACCLAEALEDKHFEGRTIELGGPEHLTYEEIVDLIMKKLKVRRIKLFISIGIMHPLVWVIERVLPNPPVTTIQLAMLKQDNITELDTVEKNFGFRPTRLKDKMDYVLKI